MGIESGISLYIHFPFCKQKCFYCDFISYPYRDKRVNDYIKRVCQEIAHQSKAVDHCGVNTIYIGGGTPSLLTERMLDAIFNQINDSFHVSSGIEITIEANPGTFRKEQVETWVSHGINRVSVGVQAFDNTILEHLGRIHSKQQAIEGLQLIKKAGISNFNIDLIYGLPGQKCDQWIETLEQAVELKPMHISAYQLINEENTRLHYQLLNNSSMVLPDENEIDFMEKATETITAQAGMLHYEVSNYAIKGYECKHNLAYWQCKSYLGIGCSAHSFLKGCRFCNTDSLNGYILQHKAIKYGEKSNGKAEAMFERIMLGLRMYSGVDLKQFKNDFHVLPERVWPESFSLFENKGYTCVENNHWKLSPEGMHVMNSLLVMLLSEMEKMD